MPSTSLVPVCLSQMPTFPSPIDSKGFAFAIPGTPYIQTTESRFFFKWPFGKIALWLFLLFIVAVIVVAVDVNDTGVIVTGVFPKGELETSSASKDASDEMKPESYDATRTKRSVETSPATLLLKHFTALSNTIEHVLSHQQCYQRFTCEIGITTRILPGFHNFLSYYSIAKFFVNASVRRALDNLSRKEDCSNYECGPAQL